MGNTGTIWRPTAAAVLVVASGVVLTAAGCLPGVRGEGSRPVNLRYLSADTATPNGRFSPISHQFAYDGEPVALEMEVPGGLDTYVVFNIEGRDIVADFPDLPGRYRVTHRFGAGPSPQTYRVYAAAYLVRGRRDWLYDKTSDSWRLAPRALDPPDLEKTPEEAMQITAYRREVSVTFEARGGAPRAIAMTLTKQTGERLTIPRRAGPSDSTDGFFATGAVDGGRWTVTYTPTHDQVSRAGSTHVELLVEHRDGTMERLESNLDTP